MDSEVPPAVVVLTLAVVAVLVGAGVVLVARFFRQHRDVGASRVLYLLGLFFVLVGASRLFQLVQWLAGGAEVFFVFSQLCVISALVMMTAFVEHEVVKLERYPVSLALVVLEVLYLAYPPWFQLPLAVGMAGAALFVVFLFLRLAVRSEGDVRTRALLALTGVSSFLASYLVFGLEVPLTGALGADAALLLIGVASAGCVFVSVPLLLAGLLPRE
ncbi:MAG: hypothetical protein ACTSU5_20225 [Promethearchaeota archaeon]